MKISSGLFLSLIAHAFAYNILFQQSNLNFTVPVTDSIRQVYEKVPLIKLEVIDTFSTSFNSSTTYSIEESSKFVQISPSGELWFKQSSNIDIFTKFVPVNDHITIIATKSNDIAARVHANINFIAFDNVAEFCGNLMCFYDSATFNTLEDFNGSFKQHEVGEVAPRFYRRICKKYHVEYKLLNATEYFMLKNSKLFTSALMNRERDAELKVSVQCTITHDNFSRDFSKTFSVNLIDVNDNGIRVQENHKVTSLTLPSPYFKQNTQLSTSIVFLDDDSEAANSEIEFHLLHDDSDIFNVMCTRTPSTHTGIHSTAIYCSLEYKKNGHFTNSPYCVILQAKEIIKRKIVYENSTICIFTDLSQINAAEMLPSPEKLRAGEKSKRINKITSSSLSPRESEGSRYYIPSIVIEFPSEAIVLQNASFLARVAEPLTIINETKISFKMINDPFEIFDITRTGGIIYVENKTKLEMIPASSFNITVGHKSQNFTIVIIVEEAQSECEANRMEACSKHADQGDCEKSCGYGSMDGFCKWRPFEPEENQTSLYSYSYGTCVPNLDSCPDTYCDPLEKLAGKTSEYICLQDCTTRISGFPHSFTADRKQGIGKVPFNNDCTCGDDGACFCGIHRNKTETISPPSPPQPAPSSSEVIFASQSITGSEVTGVRKHSDCGTVCLIVMIGSPSLLVFMIIFLVSMRRRYVKKMKKRMMMNGTTVHYRGSNDTEIININILNEIQKENYLQTYQKFDFDAKWEFDREKLILDTTLGEGEFGKVMKAYASDLDGFDTVKTVAVKTVKTSHNSVELLALLSEFQLLQEVSHPNVIKLLGACIKSEPPLIIIEYCCFGSLRSYLRLSRKLEESGDLHIDGVEPVTSKDVLSFCWQICKGMSYLADIKLVHRDLAARNVLLAEGRVCKISDFGLTRDVYEDDAYLKKSKDRVPVKWMSPESLADHVYTTKTDVWSFGIVGWEIITLGASPYPGIPPQNLYHLLRTGYRMERPENCSVEIYSLLESCWADDPVKRPSFKSLAMKFEKLLGKCAKYLDVDVTDGAISNPMYNIEETEIQSNKMEENEERDLGALWAPPKFKADINIVDNKRYLLKYDDQLQLLLARYDKPKSLAEAKSINQKLRYQNDFHSFFKPNRYVNTSQPDLLSIGTDCERERLIESRYDTPSLKRIKSYIEMRNVARARHYSNSTTNDSFDDNNNEMPCKRTTINENLNFNDLDKLLNAEKEISFKFSSLNNLNQRLTETKC